MSQRIPELVQAGQASRVDLECIGTEAVQRIKSDLEAVHLRVSAHETKAVEGADRTIRFVFSDESIDSMGDIIRQDGWDLSRYEKNPVILWAHDGTSNPPVGRASNVHVQQTASGPRLVGDIEFAPKEASEFNETLYQLAASGFLKAGSVGFQALEVRDLDADERKALGMDSYGVYFQQSKLLEYSLVSVGANENALQNSLKGLVDSGAIEDRTARNFVKAYPLTEMDWRKRVKAACRSFVDMGANSQPEMADTRTATDEVRDLVKAQTEFIKAQTAAMEAVTERLSQLPAGGGWDSAPDQTALPAPRKRATWDPSDFIGEDVTSRAAARVRQATERAAK